MAPVLGYWNIRGLGETTRYLLHYVKVEFEDRRYPMEQEHDMMDNAWTRLDKTELGLELPNLPYYIDGDVRITQSMAILRYLARKHNLYYPSNDSGLEIVRFEVIEGHLIDLARGLSTIAYNSEFHKLKELVLPRMENMLKQTAAILGSNTWLFGEKISHLDFLLFEALDRTKLCYKDCLDSHENLRNFMERFASLPGIKEYRSTSPKWPFYLSMATWGGKGEAPE